MKRRSIISVAGGVTLAVSLPVLGQTRQKPLRIGFVAILSRDYKGAPIFTAALRESGLEVGRDFVWEPRFTEGQEDRVPGLFAELASKPVDLILAVGDAQIAMARKATATIPIVMMYSDAPVNLGFVASLSRPGGYITGMTAGDYVEKNLQMLHDISPSAKHLGLMLDPAYPASELLVERLQPAAAAMGCRLRILPSQTAADVEAALALIVKDRVDALTVTTTLRLLPSQTRIIEFAALHRLPAMYYNFQWVRDGGLIGRQIDEAERIRQAIKIVSKVLKGAKPADIPIEQATRHNVVINLKTARAMGLKIPQSVLLQATEVIE